MGAFKKNPNGPFSIKWVYDLLPFSHSLNSSEKISNFTQFIVILFFKKSLIYDLFNKLY